MIQLSMSMLETYLRCRRKWYYRYVLGLEPKTTPDVMLIGSAFHAGAAAGYREYASRAHFVEIAQRGFHEWLNTHEDAKTFNGENIPLVEDMLAFWWEHEGKHQEYSEIISVEEHIPLHIGEFAVRCTPDLIARRKSNGRLVLTDHKTVGGVKEALAFLPLDFQLRTYELTAWEKYGELPEVDYNMIRREVPPGFGHRELRRNKDGSVSKNNASQDPADYVQRAPQVFTERQMIAFRNYLEETIEDMHTTIRDGRYLRSVIKGGGAACGGCPYLTPCTRELDGNAIDGVTLSLEFNREPSILEAA